MKKSLLCLSLGLLVAGGVQAQSVYSEDFNSTTGTSFPTGWSANPSATTAWKTGNQASTGSQYFSPPDLDGRFAIINDDAAGQTVANDDSKLITKSYDLSGQSGLYASMDISYLGASGTLQDGTPVAEKLTFEASTDGGNTWTVLKTFTGNSTNWWETRYIDLSSVSGQNDVEFMWRYSDDNQWMYGAAVDNFDIFVPVANDIQLASISPTEGEIGAYATAGSSVNITGTVFNNGGSPISSYTVNYQQGNNPVVSATETGSIPAFTSATFNNLTFSVPAAGNYPIKVWVTLNGDNNHLNDSADAYVAGVSFLPTKKLVFEEATGAWCGWCPRGAVGMKTMAQQYGSKAALISVHDNDGMAVSAYDALITSLPGFTGFPTVVVDRTFLGDPGPQNIVSMYNQYKNNFGFADVNMQEPSISGNNVSVNVDVKPAVDINGAKLALVVTENGVTGTGSSFEQHNYYAGGGSGAMGGYENLPSVITNEVYEFVGRSITPSAGGAASGLPATMTAGSNYSATLTATLDPSWNQDSLKYIVMLIGQDGKILNSDFTGATLGITNVKAGLNDAAIYPNPATQGVAHVSVNAKQATQAQVTITDMTGRTVYTDQTVNLNAGNNTLTVSTASLSNGAYMVNLNTEKGNISLKLNVIK